MPKLTGALAAAALLAGTSLAGATDVSLWIRSSSAAPLQGLADRYNEGRDDRIVITPVTAEQMVPKLGAAIAGGATPDGAVLDLIYLPTFAATGSLEDITDFVESRPYGSDLSPAAGQSLALGNFTFPGSDIAAPGNDGPHFLTADEVRERAKDPNVVVLDVRAPSDYGAGQIPGSVNVFWDTTLDENRVLRDPEDLRQLYAEAGVTPDKQVIIFTRGGVQLSHSYTVLSLLGVRNVDFFTGKFDGWENGALRRG